MKLGSLEVLWPWLRRQRLPLCLAIAAGTAAQAIGVALPLLLRWLVRDVDAPPAPVGRPAASGPALPLWTSAMLLGALVALQGFLHWQRTRLGERTAQRVLVDARNAMYARLQRLARGYYDDRPVGNTVIRFVGDANALRTWIARTIVAVPADAVTVVATVVAVALIDARLMAVALAPLALLVPVQLWLNPQARRLTREGRRWQSRLCGFLGERLPAMAAVQAANVQRPDRAVAFDLIERVADANVARARFDAWSHALSAAAATAALGAVGLLGAWLHQRGELGQGDLLAAVWLLLVVRGPVQRLTRANVMQQRVRVAADRIAALLARKREPGWSRRSAHWSGPGRAIAFAQVSYRHRSGKWLLRDLTAGFEAPGLVAVVGGEGRARSAVLELLLRLRRPHRGNILLDGQDIRRLRVADVRRAFGWLDRERRLAQVVLACTPGGIEQHPGFAAAWSATEVIAPGHPTESARALLSGDDRLHHAPPDLGLRLGAACALLEQPVVLLLDEPTLGVEGSAAARMVAWLERVSRAQLVVVATSDPRVAGIAAQTLDLDRVGDAARDPTDGAAPGKNGTAENGTEVEGPRCRAS